MSWRDTGEDEDRYIFEEPELDTRWAWYLGAAIIVAILLLYVVI